MNLLDLFVKITAKDEASSTIDDVSNNIVGRLASAAKTAAKALAGMWAVKKVVDFGKAAFGAYSQFEQLQGGVAKLYGNAGMSVEEYAKSVGKSVEQVAKDYKRNAEAQKMVMENAQQAWKTAGMDANTYMQTATSFSASLINSLGGDTKEAARLTDEAMVAMSDNVNTFGSDMQSVQNAFQGFAKQNYMMLDNLKLGYGGTKTEMERLIKDASQMKTEQEQLGLTVDANSMSFDNIVRAIQVVQKHQGIYGTTAKEAMSTIEGSTNAAKAAWQNFVAEIGKPDADIGARISDMADAVFGVVDEDTGKRVGGVINNVRAEVETIAANVVSAVPKLITGIMDFLPDEVSSRLQGVIDVASSIWNKLTSVINVDAIVEKIGIFADGIGSFFDSLGSTIDFGYINVAIDTVSSIVQQAWGFVEQNIIPHMPELGTIVGNVANFVMSLATSVLNVVNALAPFLPAVLGAVAAVKGFTIIQTIIGFVSSLGGVIATAGAFISTFGGVLGTVAAVFGGWPIIIAGVIGAIVGFIATNEDARAKIKEVWDKLCEFVGNAVTSIGEFMGNLGESIGEAMETVTGLIDDAIQKVVGFFDGVGKFISDPVGTIKNGLDSMGESFGGAADSAESGMGRVEKSVDGGKKSIQKYNGTKLKDKKAKAEIKGNAADGKGKKAVSDTDKAMKNMSDKRVSAEIKGNAINTAVKDALNKTSSAISGIKSKDASVNISGNALSDSVIAKIKAARDAIRTLASKTVTVAVSGLKGILSKGGAWGGITPTYHAAGGVKVASRWGEGVPLDVVGERGPEAIVPLTSRYGSDFARMMGQEASKYLGGPTYILQIGDIQYNTDKAMDEAIDHWFSVAARKAGQYGIA